MLYNSYVVPDIQDAFVIEMQTAFGGLTPGENMYSPISLDTNIAIFLRYLEVFEKFRKC